MLIRAKLGSLFTVMSLTLGDPALAQESIALIYQVDGRVLKASPGEALAPARTGDPLFEGDRLEVMQSGAAHLLYASGVERTIRESVTIRANELPPAGLMGVGFERRFRTLSRLTPPLGGSRGAVRPALGQPVMLEPADGSNVHGQDVAFRWTVTEGDMPGGVGRVDTVPELAVPLVFRIRAEDERDWTTFEVEGQGLWGLPPGYLLEPGATYRWAVSTRDYVDEPISSRFKVLTEEELGPLVRIREFVRSSGIDPDSGGSLLLALVYDELGLPWEQLRTLQDLDARYEGEMGPWFYLLRARAHHALGNMQEALSDAQRARDLRS